MDKQILNSLKVGEHIVEMQEYILHNQTVYKVIVYTCKNKSIFGKNKIHIFEFPFYFDNKAIAEEFLKYWDDLYLTDTTYWDKQDKNCFGIYLKNHENVYILVDSYKYKSQSKYDTKCQLSYDGVWNGIISMNGRYYTYDRHNCYFTKIFELENVGQKTNTEPYIFKMIKE